jgi:MPBQ/MSBQ methyltransferase
MDALAMAFPDDSFDLVWACESGEHMPDKKAYVEEMARVLAPGGQVSRRGHAWADAWVRQV